MQWFGISFRQAENTWIFLKKDEILVQKIRVEKIENFARKPRRLFRMEKRQFYICITKKKNQIFEEADK